MKEIIFISLAVGAVGAIKLSSKSATVVAQGLTDTLATKYVSEKIVSEGSTDSIKK